MLKINDMKKTFRYVLMAALTVGLSLAATSCKDDNKSDDGGENMEQLESTGGEVSMEDIQLSTLISNFAEVQADELLAQSNWQSKTYEATLGLVLDESRPTVRTIEVGTIDAADERAEAMLRELGIDGQSPSGFTFANASVGTVSYQHGGGTDANTLAVINLDVRQLPGISQLRMVKALPANDGTFGYYGRGDIVKKDGRLWICTRPATKRGDYAYFVSFWTRHRTDNCRWGTYKDVVYLASDEMASETDLISWLHTFVMWEEGYEKVIRCLSEKGITNEDDIEQLVPANRIDRRALINKLHIDPTDLPVEPLAMPDWIDANKWGDTPKANGRYCAPRSLLLANKFRYAINPCEYWVPFISWATVAEAKEIDESLKSLKSQSAKTNSNHFQYDISTVVDILDNGTKLDNGGADKCQYVVAAVHWKHEYYAGNQWAIFDFTKDWNDKQDINNTDIDDISLWLSCNIVSGTLKFKDNGEANASVQKVWVAREDDLNNNGDEGYEHGLYQPGDVLQDEMGAKWMCIFGAACDNVFGFRDKTAWFVSFDGIQQGNIVKERDLMEMAHRFTFGVYHSMTDRDDSYGFKGAGQLGQWKTAYDYAGIDMSKMWVHRDTTWTFTADGKTYNSIADKNLMTNIVYVGDDGNLKLLRCIADNSQGGSERTAAKGPSGKKYDTPKMRFYKHYETFDTSQMEPLNDDEKALSMTMWMKPWAITNKEMHFSDLSSQNIVDKYAANDKWVTLPLHGTTERQKPKTSANYSAYGRGQYEYNTNTKDFYTPGLTGIFKEPVLIMRLMKVTDNGGTTPNLTAQDGTKLTVVKLVENPYLYDNNLVPMINYMLRNNYQQSLIFLDNKPYQSDYKF